MADIKVYTLDEVSELLKVTIRTLYRYIDDNKLKASKIGNKWIVTDENLKAFIKGQEKS